MFNKVIRIIFILAFFAMILVPLSMTNLKNGKISVDEKRKLASIPEIHNEDGTWNKNYTADFENWINDNIGLRSKMVIQNARIQFYVFNVLSNNTNKYLGPNGELNYATDVMLVDYQRKNLYTEEELQKKAESLQCLKDYVVGKGLQFYYVQCWDKHSIYPEYFPTTVIQSGEKSKTDYFVDAFERYTDVNVISSKQLLIDEKKNYATYSVWGDPSHWTQRGAYLAYLQLMNAINSESDNKYKILQESDYNISVTDQGETVFGGIHKPDYEENFEIKDPQAVLTNEKLTYLSEDSWNRYFTNDSIDNDTRVLFIGDSYFDTFIIDDMAESFHEVIVIWGTYLGDAKAVIEAYDPDIVIVENAERCDRTKSIEDAAKKIKESEDDN